MKQIEITRVTSDDEIQQIIELQKLNLAPQLSPEEIISQGFVTVEHSFGVLKKMNDVSPSIIAKNEDRVIGYALVMPESFRNEIPVLFPMFEMIDQLDYKGKFLKNFRYFIMGQVCIAKAYRGMGLFDSMYQKLQQDLSDEYELMITEVAARNVRSLRAHLRTGMSIVHEYTDPRGEVWDLLLWDWRKKFDEE